MGVQENRVCGLANERDRGYAWIILLAAYLPQMCSIGIGYPVAVLQAAWADEFKGLHSMPLISSIGSINCASMFCSGVLASVLVAKLGHRLTIVIGSLLTVVGYVVSFFAVNIWMLICGYGLITGVGFGLIYMGSSTIVSLWFDRYRAIACGIAASGNGLGTFVNVFLLNIMIKSSGWRATMLYQACILAQCCVVAMLMRSPPAPKPAFTEEAVVPLSPSSITQQPQPPKKKSGFFSDAVQLFKNVRFILFFINNLAWPLGIIVFYVFCVRLSIEVGHFDLPTAIWTVSCIGLIDAVSRIVCGTLSSSLKISPSIFYFTGQFGYGLVILVTPYIHAYINPFVASLMFGAFFGCHIGTLVTTTAELFDPEKISTVFGILILANGFGNGLGPIIADLLLDALDKSFPLVYLIFGIIVLVGVIFLIPVCVPYWRSLRGANKAKRSQPNKTADDSAFGILQTDGRNEEL